jgi:hypothetical protein
MHAGEPAGFETGEELAPKLERLTVADGGIEDFTRPVDRDRDAVDRLP